MAAPLHIPTAKRAGEAETGGGVSLTAPGAASGSISSFAAAAALPILLDLLADVGVGKGAGGAGGVGGGTSIGRLRTSACKLVVM